MPVKAKRNYTRERLRETKARKEARKARGRARTAMGLKDGDKRVVGHKKPLTKGGSNKKSNLRIETKSQSNKQGGKMVPKAKAALGGRRSKRGPARKK
jgi:hypothetical protein